MGADEKCRHNFLDKKTISVETNLKILGQMLK
jgi:hypothetical protein